MKLNEVFVQVQRDDVRACVYKNDLGYSVVYTQGCIKSIVDYETLIEAKKAIEFWAAGNPIRQSV